jgi:simple sugar transport system ATP-binding protein
VTSAALHLKDIHKRFGRVTALDGASFELRPGTVHALLGENGAGKTTLMHIAFGVTAPDAGTVACDGRNLSLKSPADAIFAGIGMVQQHFSLVPALTPLENIALGWSSSRRVREASLRLAGETGLRLEPDIPVDCLSVADQQRIELLKSLVRGARVLILDEPTAALAPSDGEELFSWIRAFRARGDSVVLITHKLRDAFDIADDISVLRQGKITWTGRRELATLEGLVAAMIGRPSRRHSPAAIEPAARDPGPPVVIADHLTVEDARGATRVRDASIRVHAGEIVGVAGVEGSGSHEFLYAVAGRLSHISGSLALPDGIGFVPEDRQHEALLLDRSVAENVWLKGAGVRKGWFGRGAAEAAAARLVADNDIRAPDVGAPVSTLSGGNQQRLVLARELEGNPRLVVAVNPTRGLDVVATEQVQRRLRQAADEGSAVIYHSADLDELLDIADRILVVFDGRVREVNRDRAAIGRAMLGAA